MRLRVRPEHLLVFAVRGKRKVGSFFMPTKGSVADYFELQPVWIAEMGSEATRLLSHEGVQIGDLGYVLDVYELEDLPNDVWKTYVENGLIPEATYLALKHEALTSDGVITANIIAAASLVGVEESDWKTKALLSERLNLEKASLPKIASTPQPGLGLS